MAQFSLGENSGLNVHFNLALGLRAAAQFEDAYALFLPPEPNIRTLKRVGGEKTMKVFGYSDDCAELFKLQVPADERSASKVVYRMAVRSLSEAKRTSACMIEMVLIERSAFN